LLPIYLEAANERKANPFGSKYLAGHSHEIQGLYRWTSKSYQRGV